MTSPLIYVAYIKIFCSENKNKKTKCKQFWLILIMKADINDATSSEYEYITF